jgi:hypothetical protein
MCFLFVATCNIKSMKAFISWCFAGSDARRPCGKSLPEKQIEEIAKTKLNPEVYRPETGSKAQKTDLKPEAVVHKQPETGSSCAQTA